ncbi:Immunoglobulin V-set domain [Trinorchestia longiramus]|nr:Immunoglobulin V-set domain [Trinorchestia longiramus]
MLVLMALASSIGKIVAAESSQTMHRSSKEKYENAGYYNQIIGPFPSPVHGSDNGSRLKGKHAASDSEARLPKVVNDTNAKFSNGSAFGKEDSAPPVGTQVRNGIVQRVPPSRPAPMYDKATTHPTFDTSTPSKVLAAVGQTAYLHCRVHHLGDRVVTWIRKHDVHVLTVALFTYTKDSRFTALHSEASNDWTLRLASPQVSDSGTYECQVSTEPSISRIFQLQVVEARAHIDGPTEIHMMSGSNINLTCEVTGSPEPPQYIYWYAGKTLINYSERGGISVVTDKRTRTSRLVVSRATLADSGNYTCAPANAESSSVSVYILNGEHPAAMQGGESTSAHCLSRVSVAIIAAIVAFKRHSTFR